MLALFAAASWCLRGWPARALAIAATIAFGLNLATVVYYEASVVSGDFAIFAYRNPLTWIFPFTFGYWAGRRFETLAWSPKALAPALDAVGLARSLAFVLMVERVAPSFASEFLGIARRERVPRRERAGVATALRWPLRARNG